MARKAGLLALILTGLAFVTSMMNGMVRGIAGEEESPEKIIEKEDDPKTVRDEYRAIELGVSAPFPSWCRKRNGRRNR